MHVSQEIYPTGTKRSGQDRWCDFASCKGLVQIVGIFQNLYRISLLYLLSVIWYNYHSFSLSTSLRHFHLHFAFRTCEDLAEFVVTLRALISWIIGKVSCRDAYQNFGSSSFFSFSLGVLLTLGCSSQSDRLCWRWILQPSSSSSSSQSDRQCWRWTL